MKRERSTETRYSRINPPGNEAEATERLDTLAADTARIETQLDRTSPEDFASDDEYDTWRKRATSALGWVRKESTFLERWLEDKQAAEQAAERRASAQKRGGNLAQIAEGIKRRAGELAAEIGRDYTAVYTVSAQPASLEDARRRMMEITAIRQRVQGALAEISAAWTSHPLERKRASGAKYPLTTIITMLGVESAVVKDYIRRESAKNPGGPQLTADWKGVCARALTRAVSEGFVLTAEEQATYDQLRAYLGLPPE